MIDPHWVLEDLDPRTWLAIGKFFMPDRYIAAAQPGERGLFVLHDGGRPTRVFDTRRNALKGEKALNVNRLAQSRQRCEHRTEHLLRDVVGMADADVGEHDRVHRARERCVQRITGRAIAALGRRHQLRPLRVAVARHAFLSAARTPPPAKC